MHYTKIKHKLAEIIDSTSWEQVLFALSQLAIVESEMETDPESEMISKYNKLADNLHDLSNLMG